MSLKKTPFFLTAIAVLFWSTSATAFKIALKEAHPFQLLWGSALISTIIFAIVITMRRQWRLVHGLSGREITYLALLGFLNPFLYYSVLFTAYSILPGQIAMSLNYVWPVMLTLLSAPILGHPLRPVHFLAMMISFSGVVIIATRGEFGVFGKISILGVFLALASTIIWAVFWLVNAREKNDPVVRLFVGFLFGTIFSGIYALFITAPFWPQPSVWPALIYIGFFEMGITFVIWLMAVKAASHAAEIGNLIYITPFLSLVFLWAILGEHIYFSTFLGLCLIILGIFLQHLFKRV